MGVIQFYVQAALCYSAQAYQAQSPEGLLSEAEDLLGRALAIAPHDVKIRVTLAKVLLLSGNREM